MDTGGANTYQKARQINLDPAIHGTLAEIGAGQEVARWFFRVGGAASTVAKTMSAYDRAVSDAVYGLCGCSVSRERLRAMLDHEYDLLLIALVLSMLGILVLIVSEHPGLFPMGVMLASFCCGDLCRFLQQ